MNRPLPGPVRTPGALPRPAAFRPLTLDAFHRRFGAPDTARAIHRFTPPIDTHVVLALLAHTRPRRVLEVGTAGGHMTANLTEWTPDDATVFSLGVVSDLAIATMAQQRYEDPPRSEFGRFANHFGKAHKVLFATADSLTYDFGRLGPLDFAFIDGGHDAAHVLSDTLKAYGQLAPGGCLVWHDIDNPVAWVEVRQALEAITFAEPVYHVAGTMVAFLHKQDGAPAPSVRGGGAADGAQPAVSAASRPAAPAGAGAIAELAPTRPGTLAVTWEGALEELHSLALVNRQICGQLIARGHEVSVLPRTSAPGPGLPPLPAPPSLTARFRAPLNRPCTAHVRHAWPPDFRPPPSGHWVLVQPWEFGSLPRAWVGPVTEEVDEVWAYTRTVRDCYVEAGVPADRVHVVPLGVDVTRFHPGAAPLPLQTRRQFKFLFVGGTIRRKGFDVLLGAYARTFTAADDVCLVVKDMGVGSFYRGQTAECDVARLRDTPGAPAVEYIDRPLGEQELAGLYTACDCLVLPYRGEGFGLPLAEAMACGLPVVVTGRGAALDFCDESRAYLIPSEVRYFPEHRVGDLETVGRPWLAEPDGEALAAILRDVATHPEEAKAKGAAGSAFVRDRLTWEHTADAVERRLEALRGRPVRRLAAANGAAAPRRQRISLCLIVKNEEHNLPTCLESVADLVDEVVVVDTGSADATKEVARRYRARVFDFPWVDSFATARNESLRHATGDWVLWMDADDRLDDVNREKLRVLLAGLGDDRDCYVMKCRCLPDPGGAVTVVDHVRLFRNLPELRWKYRVHEQILPAVRRAGGKPRFSDVTIDHAGYQDPALRRRKLGRDLRLLQMEDAENPNDPFTLFNLGMVRQELGALEEAAGLFRRSLALSRPADSIVRKLYALLAQCERRQARPHQGLEACQEGRSYYPDDPELLLQESLARSDLGDFNGAIACLEQLLAAPAGEYLASVDAGLRGYLARSNLAALYVGRGRDAEGLTQWQAALAEQPDFVPAWVGLGEFYLGRGRLEEVANVAGRLEALPAGRLAGRCLRGRSLLARKEFAAARTLLEAAQAEYPEASAPCLYLSHALLQEGRDWAAAEEALRGVLRLDPDDRTARNNLGVLLRQQGRPAEAAAVEGPTLAELYRQACETRSGLHEHCPTLAAVARECRHVTELGMGAGVSTVALLFARPGRLVCYDRERHPQVDRLAARAGQTEFVFRQADVLRVEIEETDLLFIDTYHVYEQLREELRRHAGRVRKLIVLHDTTRFGLYGEAPGHAGLWPAVEEFLNEGAFRLKERYENNHGLAVLERIPGADPGTRSGDAAARPRLARTDDAGGRNRPTPAGR
jgi:glycosyltransferase involved in cell wall biosynthesis/tetratricopeptide (TPR) repeat protein/predicted O-methyltransferase YrrM